MPNLIEELLIEAQKEKEEPKKPESIRRMEEEAGITSEEEALGKGGAAWGVTPESWHPSEWVGTLLDPFELMLGGIGGGASAGLRGAVGGMTAGVSELPFLTRAIGKRLIGGAGRKLPKAFTRSTPFPRPVEGVPATVGPREFTMPGRAKQLESPVSAELHRLTGRKALPPAKFEMPPSSLTRTKTIEQPFLPKRYTPGTSYAHKDPVYQTGDALEELIRLINQRLGAYD